MRNLVRLEDGTVEHREDFVDVQQLLPLGADGLPVHLRELLADQA